VPAGRDNALAWLACQRVARLATADAESTPHVVPVCYALSEDGTALYITIDEKPKSAGARPLKRLRNIAENPQVALVADRYDEDWMQLAWVMVRGTASILTAGTEHDAGQALLRKKYPQYRAMNLNPLPVICVEPRRVTVWGNLPAPCL